MFEVRISAEAQQNFLLLPRPMQGRVQEVFVRLARWPNVSGAKPLRYEFKGASRIRTGDWRVLFTVDEPTGSITVFRIDNRRDVYK